MMSNTKPETVEIATARLAEARAALSSAADSCAAAEAAYQTALREGEPGAARQAKAAVTDAEVARDLAQGGVAAAEEGLAEAQAAADLRRLAEIADEMERLDQAFEALGVAVEAAATNLMAAIAEVEASNQRGVALAAESSAIAERRGAARRSFTRRRVELGARAARTLTALIGRQRRVPDEPAARLRT